MIVPFDIAGEQPKGNRVHAKDLLTMRIDLRIEKESEKESRSLLHEKLMIIDDRYVVIGSTNINYRSSILPMRLHW
jgi:cardiolipin synthase